MGTDRRRADLVLVERGLFESRAKAQAAIAAGRVTADSNLVRKPSEPIAVGALLQASPEHPFVSRGGLKLEAGLSHFGFDPAGHVCLDVGASTGGFTEVLLLRGASRVYAIDVGRGQLHSRLRGDPRVVSLEETDIRSLDPARLPERPDFLVMDVSFIPLGVALRPAIALLCAPATLIALIKPQFEAGRADLKKGIVRDPAVHRRVCEQVAGLVQGAGWHVEGLIASPIEGGDGNREFLLGATRD
jgi:23S rRNA (cytidine1920-2'-O)/16S rRNA (cytidine1409-2'-O)-methyltransferase